MKRNLYILILILFCNPALNAQTDGLDPNFNSGGIVISDFASEGYFHGVVNGIAIQPDQKIIAAGSIYNSTYSYIACRYNADGSVDDTFGNGGKMILTDGPLSYCSSIALKNNGQILLGGTGIESQFNIKALTALGQLDLSFNNSGNSSVYFGDVDTFPGSYITNLIILPDDKILATGYVTKSFPLQNSDTMYFALARYLSSGDLDSTFGNNGTMVVYGTGSRSFISGIFDKSRRVSVKTQSDGKIILSGTSSKLFNISGQEYESLIFTTVRLTSEGIVDPTFGENGIVKTPVKNSPSYPDHEVLNNAPCLHVHSDDKIIVAGFAVTETSRDFALVKYSSDGILDNTFGTNGIVITNPSLSLDFYGNDEAHAIHVFDDGRILLAGVGIQQTSSAQYLASILTMYTSDGQLDPLFDADGIKSLSLAGYASSIEAMTVQSDGAIVLGGYSQAPSQNPQITLARLNASETSSLFENNLSFKNTLVYPNPCSTALKINQNDEFFPCVINIVDQIGRIVKTEKIASNNEEIEIALLENGIYQVEIYSNNQKSIFSIMKN